MAKTIIIGVPYEAFIDLVEYSGSEEGTLLDSEFIVSLTAADDHLSADGEMIFFSAVVEETETATITEFPNAAA